MKSQYAKAELPTARRALERDMRVLVEVHGVYLVLHALVEICHERRNRYEKGSAELLAPIWQAFCHGLTECEDLASRLR